MALGELPERPEKITPAKPKLCTVLKDVKTGDYHYVVEEERLRSREGLSPKINVWWSREPRKVVGGRTVREEHLIIRQENGRVGADVLLLTHGQAYDLMDALARAVESR